MKPLKFRIFGTKENKYLTPDSFYIDGNGDLFTDLFDEGGYSYPYMIQDWQINDYIIEYSTGILDKEGKEIYVGDILIFDYEDNASESSPMYIYIRNLKDLFYFEESFGAYFDSGRIVGSRIVGNRYENPEMWMYRFGHHEGK